MKATIDMKNRELVIRIPLLDQPELSNSGRFSIIARTDRFEKAPVEFKGKQVAISVCAGTSAK